MTAANDSTQHPARSAARAARPPTRTRLKCVAASVPAARQFIAAELIQEPPEVGDIAALLVSELSTNCVIHAGTEFDIAVSVSDREIRIEVTDYGPGEPTMADPSPSNPHGRGLRFVDTLASTWGSFSSPSGAKTTWFALAVPSAASHSQ